MTYVLALLVVLLTGDAPRVQKPWHLNVVVERGGELHTLHVDYDYEDDCREDMLTLAFSPTQEGVEFVEASCERRPFET